MIASDAYESVSILAQTILTYNTLIAVVVTDAVAVICSDTRLRGVCHLISGSASRTRVRQLTNGL